VIQPFLHGSAFRKYHREDQPKRAVYHTLEAQCLHTGNIAVAGLWRQILLLEITNVHRKTSTFWQGIRLRS